MTKIQKIILNHYRDVYRERFEKFKFQLEKNPGAEIGSPPNKEVMGMAFTKLKDHRYNFKIFIGVKEKELESRKPEESKYAG